MSYFKERRDRLYSAGLCVNCGVSPHTATAKMCDECGIKARAASNAWRVAHPDKWKKLKNNNAKKRRNETRLELLKKLGGKCVCCGEEREQFLQIDHVNRDGSRHRKECHNRVVLDLLKNPDKYQTRVLCANCHFAITVYGACPHESSE